MNVTGNYQDSGAEAVPQDMPRTLADLRSFLHGYVIKAGGEGNEPRRFRAANLVGLIDTIRRPAGPYHDYSVVQIMRRQSTELAAIDPSLFWLPDWKPRVAVNAGSDR